MVREIGSEFWEADIKIENKTISVLDYKYLLTGRTALDYIIKDIKTAKSFTKVYMPSYCCHSMLKPFVDNGISIEFYNVNFKDGEYTYGIDVNTECEAVLVMQYFGYCNNKVLKIIEKFKEKGSIIIEDATHSWFSQVPFCYKSDYVFVSFRKWTGVPCGAIAIKQFSQFNILELNKFNYKFVKTREHAAYLKKQYSQKNKGNKETFLKLFDCAESFIDNDYKEYGLPDKYRNVIKKLDIEKIRKIRSINAKYLIERLKSFREIDTIDLNKGDVPLFLPVIIHNGKRDELKQYLKNNNIYCPLHWPITKDHKIESKELYTSSLSLVCDQRYGLADMDRILQCIYCFFKKGK